MKKVTVKAGQTLADIAIQEYGELSAIVDIALMNELSVTAEPPAGTVLYLPNKIYNKQMADYCRRNDVKPATLKDYGENDQGD